MENYVLYDEIGRGSHSVVYKGRKRGNIEFVAIHCVEKHQRLKLQNIVRLTHELDHENIVKFCEWYETTNHIWMVFELCTGDSLNAVLSQDQVLPEDTVRAFGAEIVKGLFYIHSLSILYCDLRPSRIMTDGAGVLKLSNFGLARVEGEDELYDFDDDYDSSEEEGRRDETDGEGRKGKRPKSSPYYMAPEVLGGGPHTKESDLWSMGCLLFELFAGEKPFTADTFPELVTKIFHDDCPSLRQNTGEGFKISSEALSDLVKRLLVKEPEQRLGWRGLLAHEFWGGDLGHLVESGQDGAEELDDHSGKITSEGLSQERREAELIDETQKDLISDNGEKHDDTSDRNTPEQTEIKQGTYTFCSRPRTTDALMNHSQDETLGVTRVLDKLPDSNKRALAKEAPTNIPVLKDRNISRNAVPGPGESDLDIEKHGKAGSSANKGKVPYSRQKTVVLKAKEANTSQDVSVSHATQSEMEDGILDLLQHPSDFLVTPIADNPKIKKLTIAKWDPKALPCQSLRAEELLKFPEEKLIKHLSSILALLSQSGKAGGGSIAATQRSKLHTASYLSSLCRDGEIGNFIFESELITGMLRQIKSGFSAEFKARLGDALGLLAGNATLISENFDMTAVFTVLTEVIRDNFRNSRLKQHLLPALGEFLFYAATQEENEGHQIPEWDVPGVTFTIITRCLHEGEDVVVQHYAAKTIENVATTRGRHLERFATNDTAQLLWNVFTHCTVDAQKVTVISALCRLTCRAPALFQHVIEKAGFKAVMEALSSGLSKVQQACVTMFTTVLATRPQARRLIQERELISRALQLLDASSAVLRGKVYLMVLTMVQASKEALLLSCQARLVPSIERDLKRSTPARTDPPASDGHAYLTSCLQRCVVAIVCRTPDVLSGVLSALAAVEGRRHPSAGQAKQLRSQLPLLSILLHLVTSAVFRPRVLTDRFLVELGAVLRHVTSIDAGSTCIGTAAGPSAAEDVTGCVLSAVEAVTQHPGLVRQRDTAVLEHILPHLAALISSANGDTRVLCFRMFSDVASLLLGEEEPGAVRSSTAPADLSLSIAHKLDEVFRLHLLPQYHLILGDQDPLPAYGLKLLLSFLERSPEVTQAFLAQGLLSSLSQILQNHAGGLGTGMMQSMVGVLDCVTSGKEVNMPALLEQGLVDSVTSLFVDVATLLNEESAGEADTSPALLLPLLDTVNNILKFISREVRKALLSKNEGSADSENLAQSAERLLVGSKPLTELTGLLINFLCHEDADVQEGACRGLYLVAELYGGLLADALLPAHSLQCFADALDAADLKRQKQLLRVVKRLVASNAQCVRDATAAGGRQLLDALQRIKDAAGDGADSAGLQSLAQEVCLKLGPAT